MREFLLLFIVGGPDELKASHSFNAELKRKLVDKVKVRTLCRNRFCFKPSHLVLESDLEFNDRCVVSIDRCNHSPRCMLQFPEPLLEKNNRKRSIIGESSNQVKLKEIQVAHATIKNVLNNYQRDILDSTIGCDSKHSENFEDLIETECDPKEDEGLGEEIILEVEEDE